MKTEDAIALFASRADMYRQVAQWFFAPLSEEQIDALASQDLRGLAEEDGSPYADGYNDLYRALRLGGADSYLDSGLRRQPQPPPAVVYRIVDGPAALPEGL